MTTQSYAQSNPLSCGVKPTPAEQSYYESVINQLNGTSNNGPQQVLTDIPLNASIPIYFWINKRTRMFVPSASDLEGAVNRLNASFHFPNNAHFTICGQSYIDDSRYYTLSINGWDLNRALYGDYHKENVINVYLTETVDAGGWSYYPFSPIWEYLPAGPQMVVLQLLGDYSYSNNIFSHEIGHCLGLFHTFNETYGNGEAPRERVIRENDPLKPFPINWRFTADKMQSTPAEIGACNPLVSPNCSVSPCSILDDNGDTYVGNANATNFMSYAYCPTSQFTTEQQNRMNFSLMSPNERSNIVNGSCAGDIASLGVLERKRYSQYPTDECFDTGNDTKVVARNATVTIQNSSSGTPLCSAVNSDDFGYYTSCSFPKNSSITIKPTKNSNYLENVSTLDIAYISRHILGIIPLTHPYQMLAADVDISGDITGLDMLILRRMILRQINIFPNNVGSWRFVPNYFLNQPSFENTFKNDPFAASYQGYCYDAGSCGNSYMDKVTLDMSTDEAKTKLSWSFAPFKVGDVTYCNSTYTSATGGVGMNSARVANTYQLRTARPMSMRRTEEKTIVLKSKSAASVMSMQIGLNFSKDKLKIKEIEKGDFESANDVFDFSKEDKGELRALWFNKRGKAKNFRVGTVLLKAKVKADANIDDILTVLNLDDQILKTEFYDESGNLVPMELEWDNDTDDNSTANGGIIVNAFPNPFRNEVSLEINSPVAESASITISNIITGQRIVIQRQLLQGANVVNINNTSSLSPGMLTYSIVVGRRVVNGTITKTR